MDNEHRIFELRVNRLLLHPAPELTLAAAGARRCDAAGWRLLPALEQLAGVLGLTVPEQPTPAHAFDGPCAGHRGETELLARACWALALLVEPARAGVPVAMLGPLGRFRGAEPSGEDLLNLAPDDALTQLAAFRQVFEHALLPPLATRHGPWVLGPTFTGSRLVGGADADLIAAGVLVDVKTTQKPNLSQADVFQLISYALLDFDDAFHLDTVALFSARFTRFANWPLAELLAELAGRPAALPETREQFRALLLDHQPGQTI